MDTAKGRVYTTPVLTQASGREMWSGGYLLSPSHVTLNKELGLGEAQDTIKFSNLTQTTLPGAAMLDLEGLEQS